MKVGEMERDRSLDIAVTGMSGRFPGSSDIDGWWSALRAGRILTTRLERDSLLDAGLSEAEVDDPDYVPVRGFLPDADRFDNVLFGVSPRDSELMDPQHRLMIEAAWAALEDAATGFSEGSPTTGVYASGSGSGYLRRMLAGGMLDQATLDQALHGTEPDFVASLIAYKLGLTGPAVSVQTACSSSLVGLHMAVQGLLNRDCDQAIVVAAGIDFPQGGHLHVPGGIWSSSGACRPFDEAADGVVGGSGVACVVLRRLADVLEEGPEPYGVILGTAINNDGAAKAGYYAPSVTGQESVIKTALQAADVDGRSIGYLETHGTGTRVGDPIEWSAASSALKGMGACPSQVAVGALKANIGHLDGAAGLASLIKALLVVKNGVVPPMAGFRRLNPLLETDDSPLFIPTQEGSWTGPEPRRAGVSSFGIGGTNAHVIIEQPPERYVRRQGEKESPKLLLLSAADAEALSRSAEQLRAHLSVDNTNLANVSFTLAVGRAELPERMIVLGRSSTEVADRLATGAGVVRGTSPLGGAGPVVFMFPGQGSQYPGMGLPFAEALPGFSSALDDCLDAFEPDMAAQLRRAVLERGFPREELDATELAQPALFALEYAVATALWQLGVIPAALLGHSLGEITAACVAGVFNLAGAARFVAARGRAMQTCPTGAMLALGCDEGKARQLIAESDLNLDLAAINSSASCVVAGTTNAVHAFQSWLGDDVFAQVLRTNRAFHSELIEPALPLLAAELSHIHLHRPAVPFVRTATGQMVSAGEEIKSDAFVSQARQPVRFAESISTIGQHFPAHFIEVGPGRVLSTMAAAANLESVTLCPGRSHRTDEEIVKAMGTLWTLGHPIGPAVLDKVRGTRIHLPGYPFEGLRWVAPEAVAERPPRNAIVLSRTEETAGSSPESTTVVIPPSGDEPIDALSIADVSALLANLWTEFLGRADVTDDSDFFQLGGDSLLITHLARRVNQKLGIQVPLRDMLSGRTLGKQKSIVLDLLRQTARATRDHGRG